MFTLKEKIGTPSSPIRNTLKIFMPNKFWTKILKKKKNCNRISPKKKPNFNPKQIPNKPNPNVFSKKKKKNTKFQDPPPHSYLGFSSSSSYLSLLRISSSFPLFHWPLFLQPLHLLHLFLNMCQSLFLVLVHSLESRN